FARPSAIFGHLRNGFRRGDCGAWASRISIDDEDEQRLHERQRQILRLIPLSRTKSDSNAGAR
ncbi:unnamed protein product, partial [Symbiodinium pilosum]